MHSHSGFLRAGRLLTLPGASRADSIWWRNGRIEAVGTASGLARLVPSGTREYSLPDGWVTPGFVDSHTHFALWAVGRSQVQLAGAASLEDALTRVRQVAPVDGWVVGQGWDANGWDNRPTRWHLDPIHRGPVFLQSLDVHAAWVNSSALAAAGIERNTPDPYGGVIVRDASGEPTGLLLERAVDLVRPLVPVPRADQLSAALLAAQAEAHRLGITGIHNVENHHAYHAFRSLERQDLLRLRVLFHHPVSDLPRLVAAGIRSGAGGPWLTEGGVKMFLDGSLGSRTAWMLQPYEGTRDRGMPISEEASVRAAMTLAADNGLASVVHAIGDAAVRRALDLMEPLPPAAIRHRIEHCQCVHPSDLGRASGRGIVLSMQPAHILTDIPLADRHWGMRGRGAYAFRTLLAQGSLLAFGSDTPVASIDPREGVYAAMERRQSDDAPRWYEDQRLDLDTVVRAYTAGPALAAGVAATRGTLAPGSDADLVVWQQDRDAPPSGAGFREARVALTVVGGEAVYTSPVTR